MDKITDRPFHVHRALACADHAKPTVHRVRLLRLQEATNRQQEEDAAFWAMDPLALKVRLLLMQM